MRLLKMRLWLVGLERLVTSMLGSPLRALAVLRYKMGVVALISPVLIFAHAHPPMAEMDIWCEQVTSVLKRTASHTCSSDLLLSFDVLSVRQRVIPYADFKDSESLSSLRVLVLGGIHGDEWTTVSLVLSWIHGLSQSRPDGLDWRLIPLINPDGFLGRPSSRVNANGVDINRNFPTPDWYAQARQFWQSQARKNPRRNPGLTAGSEPETKLVIHHIEQYKPDVILSLHAPYGLVDIDGPQQAPIRFGTLPFRKLKTFPGSLGSYAGVFLGIPVVTVELENARLMPSQTAQARLWHDLVVWLQAQNFAKQHPKYQMLHK